MYHLKGRKISDYRIRASLSLYRWYTNGYYVTYKCVLVKMVIKFYYSIKDSFKPETKINGG